jgi:uncharacterized protein YqjF (DUF2071 family)
VVGLLQKGGVLVFVQGAIASPVVQESRGNQRGLWRWSQHWRDLLFTHWRVSKSKLLPHLPAGLELDTWEDSAWVSAVAFRLGVRLRGLSYLGPCPSFLELNFRTYVRRRGEPAIYFLSIHAGTRAVVALARWFTPLPYAYARITYDRSREPNQFSCFCQSGRGELFQAEVWSPSGRERAVDDPLDVWLLERYRAYVAGKRGELYRMVVQHPQWRVQKAVLKVSAEGLGEELGLDLGRRPDRLHVSAGMHALVWPFEVVGPD